MFFLLFGLQGRILGREREEKMKVVLDEFESLRSEVGPEVDCDSHWRFLSELSLMWFECVG